MKINEIFFLQKKKIFYCNNSTCLNNVNIFIFIVIFRIKLKILLI